MCGLVFDGLKDLPAGQMRQIGFLIEDRLATVHHTGERRRHRDGGAGRPFRHLITSAAAHRRWSYLALFVTVIAAGAVAWLDQPDFISGTRLAVIGAPVSGGADDTALLAEQRALVKKAASRLTAPARGAAALDAVGLRKVYPDLIDAPSTGDEARAAGVERLARAISVIPGDAATSLQVDISHRDPVVAAALAIALVEPDIEPPAAVAKPAAPPAAAIRPDDAERWRARAAVETERTLLAARLAEFDRAAGGISADLSRAALELAKTPHTVDPPPQTGDADGLERASADLANLKLKRLELTAKYQDDFPSVRAIDEQIAKLTGFIAEQRSKAAPHGQPLKSAANPAYALLAAEQARLTASLDDIARQRSDTGQRLRDLDKRLAAFDATEQTLAARQPATVAAASAPSGAPRLVRAGTLLRRAHDDRPMLIAEIGCAGICAAAMLPLLLYRRRRVFATPSEVEFALGLPVIACRSDTGGIDDSNRLATRIAPPPRGRMIDHELIEHDPFASRPMPTAVGHSSIRPH